MTGVAIVGASGYAARELIRILLNHPGARITVAGRHLRPKVVTRGAQSAPSREEERNDRDQELVEHWTSTSSLSIFVPTADLDRDLAAARHGNRVELADPGDAHGNGIVERRG